MLDELKQRIERVMHGSETRPEQTADNWTMIVRERNLLFVSWPIPVPQLRPLIPPVLEIDTLQDSAWITVETLNLTTLFRHLPEGAALESAEANVRTYVRYKGERGVHFLSLDSPGAIADELSRDLFKLPFRNAEVSVQLNGDNYHIDSIRTDAHFPPASFACSARLTGGPAATPADSLEAWLLNQTCLFAVASNGDVYRGYVAHRPHTVQPVEGIIETNTLVSAAGLTLPDAKPLFNYSPGDDSMAWPISKVS